MKRLVSIVTDSVACIPRELVKQYDIEVVPIQLVFGDKTYRDGVDISPAEFYQRLRHARRLPTSAGAVPGAFLEAFHNARRKADTIICVTISAKLSGMFESAREASVIAGETMPGVTIELFDSSTAAAAQGFIVLGAARAANAGKSLSETVAIAQDIKDRVYLLGMLDTLRYLIKSGRVPKAAALAEVLLKIKPVFALKDGDAHPVGNSRSVNGGLSRIIELMELRVERGQPLHAAVMHADTLDRATELKDRIARHFNCVELFVTEFTPVMGAHTGPGVVGVAFYADVTPR